jgi:hypothetical protein
MYFAGCCWSSKTERVDMGHYIVSSFGLLLSCDGKLLVGYPVCSFHLVQRFLRNIEA